MPKRYLITGGAGFVGSSIAKMLLEAGDEVRIFDNLRRDVLAVRGIDKHPNLELIVGDVLDAEALEKAALGMHRIVHCAAIAGIDTVIKSPTATLRINFIGTANALEAAKKAGNVELFINFSTSEVFGSTAWGALETDKTVMGAVGEARWAYAMGKAAAEHLAHAYWKEFQLPTVTVRPFNIYGPGQVGEGAIQVFIKQALKHQDLTIHGDGNQIRAWCYVDDFIGAIRMVLDNPEKCMGESFNIGNSRAVITTYGLAQAVVRLTQSKSRILFDAPLSADVELRVPRVDKARKILGFEAQVDLDEGLLRTAEFYRSH